MAICVGERMTDHATKIVYEYIKQQKEEKEKKENKK
jgi:hypothetical protein